MTIRSFGCALALTVCVLNLSGCVSAAKDTAEAASSAEQDVPDVAGAEQQPADGAYQDQQVAAAGANPQQQQQLGYPQQNAMMPIPANSEPGSLTMQSTGLKATSSSIFSVQIPNAMPVQGQAAETGQGTVPLPTGQNTGVNPASNSLFNSGQPAANPTPLPLEGASNTQGTVDPGQQMASAEVDSEGTPLPVNVPVPSSGDTMRAPGDAHPAVQTAFTETVPAQPAIVPNSSQPQDEDDTPDQAKKTLTLAGLFAAKRRNKNQFDGDRFAKAPVKKTQINSMQQPQIAALGFTALPGVRTTSMFATTDDSEPSHDDDSPSIQLASLPGLARLAPNGLWLQTDKVETGCFKPDLLQVLKVVENHYGRKIMVTSGLRDIQHNRRAGGRPHSRHTTCEAADIQVPGVSKWDLAQYLRTIPGRGGVGTYCHTESVHIDTGESRDWNWRCRRRRG
ncbi:D-Ala-D-Ala carboxypeptidase family metallohydrolase [Pararhizobium sp.]|uniref:D-Ala-D-Ala carboxypeptidase family metallohydrolase n=1 Tax=Pararhizobium sp. TaxID=1977563 RepID=UPI002D7E4466|nr:D-Ala-D-Ala carboxypeptidase family metallohydrolase [Pararhizobium sp.]